ncbi:hypothetical protein [Streptomyces sp. NBC_00474]|uniref:hypothetical protein n=1 Tax=Streptomyces sp. NBC_00474 TaxID=2975754 RepID=UPI0022582718|nr:hypothetical protein [Streptomyces sp. NBC_00474]MCX5055062.1 hypothetical protein [Streptomyces sp. NBC_00474]
MNDHDMSEADGPARPDAGQVARAAREIGDVILASTDGSLPDRFTDGLLDRYPLDVLNPVVARIEGSDIKMTDRWQA